MSQPEASSQPVVGHLAREVAAVAVVATFVGRVFAPALQGAHHGIDQLIRLTDFVGAFTTYLFAFIGTAALVRQLTALMQEQRIAPLVRFSASGLCTVVASLLLPAMLQSLPPSGRLVLAIAAVALALLAASTALRVPRTRAAGGVLAMMGIAGIFHVVAAWLFAYAGDRALYGLATTARALATVALAAEALGVLTALVWLSARGRRGLTVGSQIALVIACVVTFGAAEGGREMAALWQVLAYRGLERLHMVPEPLGPRSLAYLIESFAPLLAVVAWLRRNEMASITGALALTLLALGTPDIPLCALALALASVSAMLAARDEKGMWAVLLAAPRT